ncbi:hypothetical protein [Parvularcula dongshanensis]|uniref:Uncharacterized protein n=1 Tax=Parvularcula dongshanensis TaxID=1173995 RepID=A0A840I217_9PROT|nr:hypothetical protein [Parvularcula dongshanensis]MBB4658331.1 hypothetical protein [Parvularcula dongshanensis]
MTVQEWIEANVTPSGEASARIMRDVLAKADALGGEAYVTPNGRQLGVRLPAETSKGSVVALELKSEPARICLPLRWIQSAPAYQEEDARQGLRDELSAVVGDLSTEGVTGYPDFPAEALEDAQTKERFGAWLEGMAATLKGAESPAAEPSAEAPETPAVAPATQSPPEPAEPVEAEPAIAASAPAEEEALPAAEEAPGAAADDALTAAPAPVPPANALGSDETTPSSEPEPEPEPEIEPEAPPAASEPVPAEAATPEEKHAKARRPLVTGGILAAIGATAMKLLRRG